MKLLLILMTFYMSLGEAQVDPPVFKNQRKSSTAWGELNIKKFLSLDEWKDQIAEQALVPEWETIARERNNREMVGRFFQCVGTCRIDQGESFFNPSFRTAIYEGDEVQTIGESYAWIFLLDGTMVRLSPESSINFNELNIGVKENFLSVRVNTGNILWLSRNESMLSEEDKIRETDVLFNPIALYEAQPITDKKAYKEDDLIELVSDDQTILNQYKNLNKLIQDNNKFTRGKPTYAFIVMPNLTIMGYNPSVEIVSLLGGKTFLKKRSANFLGLQQAETLPNQEIDIQMRGLENFDLKKLPTDQWLTVDEKGRDLAPTFEDLNWLTMGEFITKRIPSLLVAREIMLSKYSDFLFQEKYDPKVLATQNGYRLWGEISRVDQSSKKADLELRLDFLKEYFRRIETTNLLVSSQFGERLKERGEKLKSMKYGEYFFIKALNKYYSYGSINTANETGEELNSTTKTLWKRMHGIR
jgi:hypothetical protein